MSTQKPQQVTVQKLNDKEVRVTFPDNVTVKADQISAEELLRALTDSLFPSPSLGGGGCGVQLGPR